MARIKLNAPQFPHSTFNTGDSPELGDTPQALVTSIQSMLDEAYGRTGGNAALAASGLIAQQIPLTDGFSTAGVFLTATPGSGAFGISLTAGTSIALTGESTSASTKTDDVLFDYVLPQNYIAGQNITLTANAKQAGAGTVSAKTIDALAYLLANDGTMGADIIAVAAKTLTNANADYAWTIPGSGLVPGSHLLLRLTTVITTSAGAANAQINSVRVS